MSDTSIIEIPCPLRLFKYSNPDRVDILQTLSVRFTQPSALNDPFELRPVFDQVFSDDWLEKELDPSSDSFKIELNSALRRRFDELSNEERQNISFSQFMEFFNTSPEGTAIVKNMASQLLPVFKAALKEFAPKARAMLTETLQSRIGIFSLSSDPTNPLLWAHYADNGRGLAYEFDTSNSFFHQRRSEADELFHLREVRYLNINTARSLIELESADVFATKAESWSYEGEWRMLAPLDQATTKVVRNEDEIFLFKMPASAIVRVIIGPKADARLITQIREIIQSNKSLSHIKLAKLQLNYDTKQMHVIPE